MVSRRFSSRVSSVLVSASVLLSACYGSFTVDEGDGPPLDLGRPAVPLDDGAPPDAVSCPPPPRALDLLFVVDDSGGMAPEQAALFAEVPRFLAGLARGDFDGDGAADGSPVDDLQVGVVSGDLGVGENDVPGCRPIGDDGVLARLGEGPTCRDTLPPFTRYLGSRPIDDVVNDIGCVLAGVGADGCGFEQPLDAMLKALTPASDPVDFAGGTTGHGSGANIGFVRPDAGLAIVLLTDEDDCSARDPALYDLFGDAYPGDPAMRCLANPDALWPVSRYARGLARLKADPSRILFAAIAGVPLDLEGNPAESLATDPRIERVPAAHEPAPVACAGIDADVPPSRRILETAATLDRLGAHTVTASACRPSYADAMERISAAIRTLMNGRCDR